jgi:ADP-ribosylglycohydrolase
MIPEVLETIHPYRYIGSPSIAYRLALAAAGDGAVAVSWHNPGDWDFGAGHALVRGAGGVFLNDKGQEISYTPDGESRVQRCFGGDEHVVRDLLKMNWSKLQTAHTRNPEIKPRSLYTFSRPKAGKAIWNPELLSRAQGCFFGQCAGDAFGQQVEFLDSKTIRSKFPEGLETMEDGGTWNNLAGQLTDDSEMALLLARTIVDRERYDAEKVAQAYAYWFHETDPYDIGNTTSIALSAVKGEHIRDDYAAEVMSNAANAESQANGSLMRISPLGIYGYRMSVDQLWKYACIESSLTHPNPVCQQACALYVCAIAHAIESGHAAQEIYQYTVNLAKQHNVESLLMNALQEAEKSTPEMSAQAGWVVEAFQNAFYQLLYCSSAAEAIINTTSLGGDTDTNSAIAGALCGAVFGRDSVPFLWRQMVLSCRPHPIVHPPHPRPLCLWASDLTVLTERLMLCG